MTNNNLNNKEIILEGDGTQKARPVANIHPAAFAGYEVDVTYILTGSMTKVTRQVKAVCASDASRIIGCASTYIQTLLDKDKLEDLGKYLEFGSAAPRRMISLKSVLEYRDGYERREEGPEDVLLLV